MVGEKPLRVVMADDHAPSRAYIREALEAGGFEVCGEAAGAEAAVATALDRRPDIVLLDIHMPGSGIQAAAEISQKLPDCSVVMLTHSQDDEDLFDSLRAGASGYLLKDTDPKRLPHALRGVLSGESAIPRTLVARIVDEFKARPPRRFARQVPEAAKLTSREWEVMELLSQGLTTEEVARRLFVSPNTVRVHVSTVLRKLRVKDRRSAFDLLRRK